MGPRSSLLRWLARGPRRALGVLLVVLGGVLGSSIARANEGKPVIKDPALVPAGAEVQGIPEVTIRREQLSFDFGPVLESRRPQVAVAYALDNEGATLTVPLVFASFLVSEGHVRFDGQEVPVRPLASDELPRAWDTPKGPVASVSAGQPDASGMGFTLEVPPGPHRLEVEYRIDDDFSTWSPSGWSIPYALEPARSWKAVEALDLSVTCPPMWSCAVYGGVGRNPEGNERRELLNADGTPDGVIRRHWDGLPDSGLTIVLHGPRPWWVGTLDVVLRAVGVLLLLGVVVGAARVVGAPPTLGARILRWIATVPVMMLMSCGFGMALGEFDQWQQPTTGGYGSLGFMIGSGVLGTLAALLLVPLGALVVRALRSRPPPAGRT